MHKRDKAQNTKQQEKEGSRENIHDDNFKHNFTKKDVAHDFLKHNLPKEILEQVDLSTIAIENTELISTNYRTKRNVDVLYSIQSKEGDTIYAIIHLEGQSTHDTDMALRIWEYQVAVGRVFYHNNKKAKKDKKIPVIVTFVLYHGKKKWTSAKSIAELFQNFGMYVALSMRLPFLIDLTKEKLEKLQKQGAAAAPQIIMKQQASGEYLEILHLLYALMKKHGQDSEENIGYMVTNDRHGEEGFLKEFRKLDPEKTKRIKSMFERAILRERQQSLMIGEKRGIERGLEQGIEKGLKQGIERGINQLKLQLIPEGLITQEQALHITSKLKK